MYMHIYIYIYIWPCITPACTYAAALRNYSQVLYFKFNIDTCMIVGMCVCTWIDTRNICLYIYTTFLYQATSNESLPESADPDVQRRVWVRQTLNCVHISKPICIYIYILYTYVHCVLHTYM